MLRRVEAFGHIESKHNIVDVIKKHIISVTSHSDQKL